MDEVQFERLAIGESSSATLVEPFDPALALGGGMDRGAALFALVDVSNLRL